MPLRAVMLATLVTSAAGPAFAAGCHVDPFSTVFGADTGTHMTVPSGQRCGITLRMGGRGLSGNVGGAAGVTLDQQAQHGTVTGAGPNHLDYVSQRGYAGPDRFVFERTGESMGRNGKSVHRGTSHYTVDVDVTR